MQVSGLGSGIDIESLVTQLMNVEKGKLATFDTKKTKLSAQISDIGKLQSGFQGVLSALKNLAASASKNALQGIAVKSADELIARATVTGNPAQGNYAVNVTSLPAGQKIVSNQAIATSSQDVNTTASSLTISLGSITGGTFDSNTGLYSGATFNATAGKSITFDIAEGSSLNEIRDTINSKAGSMVQASVIYNGTGYHLSVRALGTGSDQSIKMSATGDAALQSFVNYDPQGTQNFKQTQVAGDLQALIDGVSVSSKTNTIAGAIEGISLTLNKIGETSINVSRDNSAVSGALGGLVSAWNTLAGSYNATAAYNEATKTAGSLYGDSFIRSTFNLAKQQIFSANTTSASASEGYTTLGSIGITMAINGFISVDSAKLQKAMSADPDAVYNLLSSDKANAMGAAISSLSKIVEGQGFSTRISGINKRIDILTQQKERAQERLEIEERTMRKRFSNMDKLISSLNNTGTYIAQNLAKNSGD